MELSLSLPPSPSAPPCEDTARRRSPVCKPGRAVPSGPDCMAPDPGRGFLWPRGHREAYLEVQGELTPHSSRLPPCVGVGG